LPVISNRLHPIPGYFILLSYFLGQRMEHDDPKFIKIVGEVSKRIELATAMSPVTLFPWMIRVFPRKLFNLDFFTEIIKSFNSYAQVE